MERYSEKNISISVNKRKNNKFKTPKLNSIIDEEIAIEYEGINILENKEAQVEKIVIEKEIEIDNSIQSLEYTKLIRSDYEENNKINIDNNEYVDRIVKGKSYKDRIIIINPPKSDKIVSITSIKRDLYINNTEILENGLSIDMAISISINYGTSKDIIVNSNKVTEYNQGDPIILERENNSTIITDGVVRNATIIIPCNIYISISEDKEIDKYNLINSQIKVINTQYVLENGIVVDVGIPIGCSIKGIIEKYIISIEVELV